LKDAVGGMPQETTTVTTTVRMDTGGRLRIPQDVRLALNLKKDESAFLELSIRVIGNNPNGNKKAEK